MAYECDKSGVPQGNVLGDLYGRPLARRKHDLASYVWLVYSAFFFIQPILAHSAKYWRHQLPFYAVFLTFYISYIHFEKRWIRLSLIFGIFLLGVVCIPSNVGASSFFIYVAALLPYVEERASILIGSMVLEVVTLAIESQIYRGEPFNYAITGMFTVVVGVSNLFVAQGKRADAKLRMAQSENIELAAVAERERIARDLHDVLGHTLSVIVLKAELAGRFLGRDDAESAARAVTEIADVERTARTALAEVREAIGGYRAKGLNAEIQQARLTLDAAGVTLICPEAAPSLQAREETVLSLAVREAVTNIVRHAHATQCTMHFRTTPDGFAALEVADNGSAVNTAGSGGLKQGNGLRGMRERVEELGGRFRIEMGEGTRLHIELPKNTVPVEATR